MLRTLARLFLTIVKDRRRGGGVLHKYRRILVSGLFRSPKPARDKNWPKLDKKIWYDKPQCLTRESRACDSSLPTPVANLSIQDEGGGGHWWVDNLDVGDVHPKPWVSFWLP